MSKRKWAKKGRAIADFGSAMLFTTAENIVDFGIRNVRRTYTGIFSLKRKSSKTVDLSKNKSIIFSPVSKDRLEKVFFKDVIGLEDAKDQLRERLILPLEHQEKAKILKIAKGGGVLLHGPHGNGKTTLVKALANEIEAPLFHITPKDIIRSAMGVSANLVSELFRILKGYKVAILFLDDVDGLIKSRSTNSAIMGSIISQFLIETDGLETNFGDNVLLILAATNRIKIIDEAMKRCGRFDERIFVGPPDLRARELILRKNMDQVPSLDDIDFSQLACTTEGFSGADLKGLVNKAKQRAFRRSIALQGKYTISEVLMSDFETALSELRSKPEEK
ncbi:MAG: AAA family ATPase [bacterium]|nr:AAA family ATPase [bacterium]